MRTGVLLCAALAGCVTVTIYNSLDEMRAEAPQTILSSQRLPIGLAECIARNAERHDRGFIPTIKGGDKPGTVELIIRGVSYGTLYGMANIEPDGPGSRGVLWTLPSTRVLTPALLTKGC